MRTESGGVPLSLAETIRDLLPELSQSGSSEVVFGRPVETGGVVIIPVARLAIGVLGLDVGPGAGFGGGLDLDPVAVIVIRDRAVDLLRLETGPTRRAPRALRVFEAPFLGQAGADAGPYAAPGGPGFDLEALINAVATLIREIRRGAEIARATPSGGSRERERKAASRTLSGQPARPDREED